MFRIGFSHLFKSLQSFQPFQDYQLCKKLQSLPEQLFQSSTCNSFYSSVVLGTFPEHFYYLDNFNLRKQEFEILSSFYKILVSLVYNASVA